MIITSSNVAAGLCLPAAVCLCVWSCVADTSEHSLCKLCDISHSFVNVTCWQSLKEEKICGRECAFVKCVIVKTLDQRVQSGYLWRTWTFASIGSDTSLSTFCIIAQLHSCMILYCCSSLSVCLQTDQMPVNIPSWYIRRLLIYVECTCVKCIMNHTKQSDLCYVATHMHAMWHRCLHWTRFVKNNAIMLIISRQLTLSSPVVSNGYIFRAILV